mmetsp:Transcript_34302/g.72258  ORF Transcript_34302/g.72258 Transcript_34302/m.72258 type:complete len:205 (-) Transcript_34302:1320-1934(-)
MKITKHTNGLTRSESKSREMKTMTEEMSLFKESMMPPMTLLLLYGESLMVVLHLWILVGISLPALDKVQSQPEASKYIYLLCDASQPIIVAMVTSSWTNRPSTSVTICLAAHTFLYAAFAYDEANMEETMIWAYSPWSDRVAALPMLPGAAVCLDAICHSWGLHSLLLNTEKTNTGISNQTAWSACAIGAAVGACTMAHLSYSP